MTEQHARAVCFVALPTTDQVGRTGGRLAIDADDLFTHIGRAVVAEGLECVRADVTPDEPFPPAMAERLLIAQHLIADVTTPNAHLAYVVGVRHGAGGRPTITVGARQHLDDSAFGTAASPVVAYDIADDGALDPTRSAEFVSGLRRRIQAAEGGDNDVEIPVLDVTGLQSDRLEHDKTDLFLTRLRDAGSMGRRLGAALDLDDRDASLDELTTIEGELVDGGDSGPGRSSALLGVYLAYRERHAYQQMLDLFPKLSPELRATPVAREQLALALNRVADQHDERADTAREAGDDDTSAQARDQARSLRGRAIAALDSLDQNLVTAETWAIRGRVYKSWFSAEHGAGHDAEAAHYLATAIDAYERGLAADMRDYFPGVNAVTLRLIRAEPDDIAALAQLVPVVRMAADHAPPAKSEEETYWQTATKLELAAADRDWVHADEHLAAIREIRAADWMRATTVKNLRLQQRARSGDGEAHDRIESLVDGLQP